VCRTCRGHCPRRSRRSRPTTSSCSAGDVFTRDLLETWIEYKREREVDPVRLRPVPYEFFLYYDA
jgi:glutamine synthetase